MAPDNGGGTAAAQQAPSFPMRPQQSDRISQFLQPACAGFGDPAGGSVQRLITMIRQLFGRAGRYFQNATASSTGDPHLAFEGTRADGSAQQTHVDSMTGHRNLLDSHSFAGGFRISTAVTAPGASGVTYNREASVSTAFGATQVSLDNAGNAFIAEGGTQYALADGASYDLGDGESVSRGSDGSLTIEDANGMGGSITTTLSENGHGDDVRVQAQNVELGGDMLRTWPQTGAPHPPPPRVRMTTL
jgi:hypothetical protein